MQSLQVVYFIFNKLSEKKEKNLSGLLWNVVNFFVFKVKPLDFNS